MFSFCHERGFCGPRTSVWPPWPPVAIPRKADCFPQRWPRVEFSQRGNESKTSKPIEVIEHLFALLVFVPFRATKLRANTKTQIKCSLRQRQVVCSMKPYEDTKYH